MPRYGTGKVRPVKVVRDKPDPLSVAQALDASLRQRRAKWLQELKQMEWRWERDPTVTLTMLLKAKRMMISELEAAIAAAAEASELSSEPEDQPA